MAYQDTKIVEKAIKRAIANNKQESTSFLEKNRGDNEPNILKISTQYAGQQYDFVCIRHEEPVEDAPHQKQIILEISNETMPEVGQANAPFYNKIYGYVDETLKFHRREKRDHRFVKAFPKTNEGLGELGYEQKALESMLTPEQLQNVSVIHATETDPYHYLITPYVGSKTAFKITVQSQLKRYVGKTEDQPRHLTCEEILSLARGSAVDLAKAHANNIVHGDVKPNNYVCYRNSPPQEPFTVKLIDFGQSRDATMPFGDNTGTSGFRALEMNDRGNSLASDVYAFGITLGMYFGIYRYGDSAFDMGTQEYRKPTEHAIHEYYAMALSDVDIDAIKTLIADSTQEDRSKRPTMEHIVFTLNKIKPFDLDATIQTLKEKNQQLQVKLAAAQPDNLKAFNINPQFSQTTGALLSEIEANIQHEKTRNDKSPDEKNKFIKKTHSMVADMTTFVSALDNVVTKLNDPEQPRPIQLDQQAVDAFSKQKVDAFNKKYRSGYDKSSHFSRFVGFTKTVGQGILYGMLAGAAIGAVGGGVVGALAGGAVGVVAGLTVGTLFGAGRAIHQKMKSHASTPKNVIKELAKVQENVQSLSGEAVRDQISLHDRTAAEVSVLYRPRPPRRYTEDIQAAINKIIEENQGKLNTLRGLHETNAMVLSTSIEGKEYKFSFIAVPEKQGVIIEVCSAVKSMDERARAPFFSKSYGYVDQNNGFNRRDPRQHRFIKSYLIGKDSERQEEFDQEVSYLQRVDEDVHAKCIMVSPAIHEDDSSYIVTPHVGSKNLQVILNQSKKHAYQGKDELAMRQLTGNELLHLAYGCAQEVSRLHAQHLVHRDIKPSNFVLYRNMDPNKPFDVRLIDYGSMAEVGKMAIEGYTIAYKAPEVAPLHKNIQLNSDIYSLGMSLGELFGIYTYKALSLNVDKEPHKYFIPADLTIPDLTAQQKTQLIALIQQMTHQAPTKRPTIQNVMTTLEDIGGPVLAQVKQAAPVGRIDLKSSSSTASSKQSATELDEKPLASHSPGHGSSHR